MSKVIDFLYSEWSLRGEQKASRRFLSLEKMVGDALYTCSQEEIGGLTSGPVFRLVRDMNLTSMRNTFRYLLVNI